jgi:hypothetical protein
VRLAERVMGGVLAATLVFVGLAGLVGAASATPRVPFSDPNAVGYIGLCNQAGRQITSGSIYTTPFAWRAVSSESAPPPYNNAWRTAILLAYQPRLGLTSGEWSGDALTASSRYSNPAHPMVAATGGDDSLEDFIQEFASVWDGYFELRIYLSTQNAQVYSLHYPALAIEVKGGSWRAVGGGQVNCRSGTSESLESIVLPKSATSPPTTAAPAGHGGSGGKATGRAVRPLDLLPSWRRLLPLSSSLSRPQVSSSLGGDALPSINPQRGSPADKTGKVPDP